MVLSTLNITLLIPIFMYSFGQWHEVAQMVEAQRYKSEGRVFDCRWCHWNFSLTSFRPHYTALGLIQPLTEMSTRSISWAVKAAGA